MFKGLFGIFFYFVESKRVDFGDIFSSILERGDVSLGEGFVG